MKKRALVIVLLTLLLVFSGCAYVNVKIPLDTDLSQTTLGDKVGRASCYSILWLIAWGDAGTAAAARNGNISIITHMDEQVLNVLFGLYFRSTTIVYGE